MKCDNWLVPLNHNSPTENLFESQTRVMPVADNPQAQMSQDSRAIMQGKQSLQVREDEVRQVENLLMGMRLKMRVDGVGTSRY